METARPAADIGLATNLAALHEASARLAALPAGHPLSEEEALALRTLASQIDDALAQANQIAGIRSDLERKIDELGRLQHAGLLISSRTGIKQTLESILSMAFEVTGARYGILRLVDRQRQELITHAVAGDNLGRPLIEALPINTTSITGLVAKQRRSLCIPDVRADPWRRIYYPLDGDLEMRSELAVPLIGASGRLEGVLNLESPQVGAFSEEDSHVLQALATQAVIAIQEARLLDALQDVAERLLTQPCQQILDHLVGLAVDLLNAGAGAIWIREGEQLALWASTAGHVQGETLPLRGSLIGQAVSTRATVTSADVRVDARFARPDLARRQGWTSALIVPLLAHESEPVGAFSVYGGEVTDQSLAATDWDSKVLTILGHYAALAVRNAANQAALRAAQEQHAAAETFAAVGDVAANLLHNLNNKLGSIPVRVEGIEDKSAATLRSDPYLSAHLREIERSAREALDIVRNSLAHLQSAPLAPVSIQECVSETLASFHVPAGVRVHVTGLSDLPMVVAGKRALGLAVANLLDNAIDVMNGAGTITITGAVHADQAHISITDTGSGIPPELHARIFELNFSGRRSQRSNKLGFGLWWVRTLMMRLGGGVKVESDGKNGATFTLCLPIGEAK